MSSVALVSTTNFPSREEQSLQLELLHRSLTNFLAGYAAISVSLDDKQIALPTEAPWWGYGMETWLLGTVSKGEHQIQISNGPDAPTPYSLLSVELKPAAQERRR